LFARRRLLFVCSALRCGADAMCKEGHAMAPGPQNRLRFDRAEVLSKFRENPSSHTDDPLAHYPTAKQRVRVWYGSGNGEGRSMEENWKVSHVELLEGGQLFGFVLYDQRGRPSVSFGYADDKKANVGRNHVAAALKDAEQVLGR
jgi:hypothetical protein